MQGNLLCQLDERVLGIRDSFDILKPDGSIAAKVHNARGDKRHCRGRHRGRSV
jgi:hypothetical protein